MVSAWKFARYNSPHMQRLILDNWFLLLKRVNGGAEQGPSFAAWQESQSDYSHTLKPTVICLPAPYPWVKTWPEAATADPTPVPAEVPQEEKQPKVSARDPLPDLPEIPKSTPTDQIAATAAMGAEDAPDPAAWSDELMSVETKEEKRKKKKSPLPFILVGLLVLGIPAGYYLATGTPGEPDATPTPVVSATSQIGETPAVSLVASPSPTPTPEITTPPPPLATPLPPGNLTINGFDLTENLRERNLAAAGYKLVESHEDGDKALVRYASPDGEIIANLKLPSRAITAIQGNQLKLEGEVVADLSSSPERWAEDSRFGKFKLQAVVDNKGVVQAFTYAVDGIYLPQPVIGAPPNALSLSQKIQNKKFFESIPEEIANMRLTDGNPLLFEFLGSFENDRLKYLFSQGADPNLRSWSDGSTALHACNNVQTAQLLLEYGADPTIPNEAGQLPVETAASEKLKAVLNPTKAGGAPSPTPGVATPSVSPTPEPTISPNVTPSPAVTPPSPTP
jgi:hypothetical protein